MAGRGGATSSRGRGKFRKFTRGGGKHFSKNLRPLDADGNEMGMWGDAAEKDEDEEESEEESSEEESEDETPAKAAASAAAAELSREERKKQKKAAKEAAIKAKKGPVQVGDMPTDSEEEESEDEKMPANPNHSRAARNQTKPPKKVESDEEEDELVSETKKLAVGHNKKEREAIAAQEAKERYMKLHEAGKTDQAKADLARLKEIRRKREEEAARRLAEKEEQDEANKQKKAEIEAKEAKKREAALGPAAKKKGKK
ncbi:casein kinase substrate phosphoprotein PP28-domain-containing protein [Triangularia verruculosa]|uniref:Casein kinase substrate phosphoprotein PP28-domain-containing protein n=1 Tax=Triangularia verruculosa TaxID=2587418 RepID=A0AAN6XPZ2_9PEZI|nr:casein kinase substrate phosphoprotein PP28-domain-containing protein [Triangularia verruculosa]